MRVIKFRAWNKSGKHQMWTHEESLSLLLLQGREENGTAASDGTLDGFEIMQSTGLKDRDGVEVFEGDILKHIGAGVSKVIWESYFSQFSRVWLSNGCAMGLKKDELEENFEVIGNIYANPELLEAENTNVPS